MFSASSRHIQGYKSFERGLVHDEIEYRYSMVKNGSRRCLPQILLNQVLVSVSSQISKRRNRNDLVVDYSS